jgi:SSS family solute:Na+ symporter
MNGSAYAIGLGVASYEWMAAITLILVGIFFLPVFLQRGISTLPQFLEIRFDSRVKVLVASLFVVVFLLMDFPSILYLGALTLKTIAGTDLFTAVLCLALFTALYSLYGGLEAVAWTDLIQTFVLLAGGFLVLYFGVKGLDEGRGILHGFSVMYQRLPEKFELILDKDNPNYTYLPGISVLVGALWIANLNYWACNQYIMQRALAAKNIREAQRGVLFAGALKLFTPLILVLPGIIVLALKADIPKPDAAYPYLMNNLLPSGIKGLAFAGLIAAIVSTLSSISNAISTIYVLDIHKHLSLKKLTDEQMVKFGRFIGAGVMLTGVILAPLYNSVSQVFQFTQEFGGFYTPGTVTLFIFGLFWKRTTSLSAIIAIVATIPVSFALKLVGPEIPFFNRMGVVFLILSAVIIITTLLEHKGEHPRAVKLEKRLFSFDLVFYTGALIICALLAGIYVRFW